MSDLYLVKDGDRTVVLATEREGKIYGYIPNLETFVYNRPMSVDFLIDRDMTYEPIGAETAADIIKAGTIGRIDGRTNKFLLDHFRQEQRRIEPTEVVSAAAFIDPEQATPTQIANAKAEQLRRTPVGQWLSYKQYEDLTNKQVAHQLASDLRNHRVRAFRDIAVRTRVVTDNAGQLVVQVSRAADDAAAASQSVASGRGRAKTKTENGTSVTWQVTETS